MIKKILIGLILIVTALDLYFGVTHEWLESNPIYVTIGWFPLLAIKVGFAIFICWMLWKNKYRHERALFHFSAIIVLLLVTWGFGVVTGFTTSITYEKEEDRVVEQEIQRQEDIRGESFPLIERMEKDLQIRTHMRSEISKETVKIAIPYYLKVVWTIGLFPMVFSLVAFWIYERLLVSAELKQRKHKYGRRNIE